jgi:hypothetical protein
MTTKSNCVFCKIIRGEIPSVKVYEDDQVLAFLDIRPIQPGHTMIIPKTHIDHFMDLPDGLAQHIVTVGQRLSRQIRDVLKPERVGVVGYPMPIIIWCRWSSPMIFLRGPMLMSKGTKLSLMPRNPRSYRLKNARGSLI